MIVMNATAGIIYILLMPKKIIFETINILAQSTILYFIRIIHQYRIEISNENYVLQVEIALIIFLIIYAGYFLLKSIEDIITQTKTKKSKSKKLKNTKKQDNEDTYLEKNEPKKEKKSVKKEKKIKTKKEIARINNPKKKGKHMKDEKR